MRNTLAVLFPAFLAIADASAAAPQKEWTFLVFLNGHNNLDSFGTKDMNEMEEVGSTDGINVVVQWASLRSETTRRVLVQKDDSPLVTSPVVQELPRVDMGDPQALVDFVRWGVENYPAKRYFINVWNHGTGWHRKRMEDLGPKDISFDDLSRNSIDTLELGQAMREAASIIGHKVDLYGSDACLMAMAEIAGEMADSVETFVGSEEVEPVDGWPYGEVLKRWAGRRNADATEVGTILGEEYLKSYQGGVQGNREATFSLLDLRSMPVMNEAVRALGSRLMTLTGDDKAKVRGAARSTIKFTYGDYGDLQDFLSRVETSGINSIPAETYAGVRNAMASLVRANWVSQQYSDAKGLAIWLPSARWAYDTFAPKYGALRFQADTAWSDALRHVLTD